MATTLACVLDCDPSELPDPDPDVSSYFFWTDFNRALAERGLELVTHPGSHRPEGLWIAGVKSRTLPSENHVVVMHGDRLVWDCARFKQRRTAPQRVMYAMTLEAA